VYAGLFSSLDGVVEAPNEWQPSFDEEMGAALSRMLDELTLMISPAVAGGGRKRLFADDAALTKFALVEAQPTSSGALIATYRPIR
jgi:hypothetical protein